MVTLYENSAINALEYFSGYFRTPEVLIYGDVQASDIRLTSKTYEVNENMQKYISRLESHILYQNNNFLLNDIEEWKLKLIAVHDDSTGVLGTFKDLENNQFITTVLPNESKDSFIDYFYNRKA